MADRGRRNRRRSKRSNRQKIELLSGTPGEPKRCTPVSKEFLDALVKCFPKDVHPREFKLLNAIRERGGRARLEDLPHTEPSTFFTRLSELNKAVREFKLPEWNGLWVAFCR